MLMAAIPGITLAHMGYNIWGTTYGVRHMGYDTCVQRVLRFPLLEMPSIVNTVNSGATEAAKGTEELREGFQYCKGLKSFERDFSSNKHFQYLY